MLKNSILVVFSKRTSRIVATKCRLIGILIRPWEEWSVLACSARWANSRELLAEEILEEGTSQGCSELVLAMSTPPLTPQNSLRRVVSAAAVVHLMQPSSIKLTPNHRLQVASLLPWNSVRTRRSSLAA